MLRDFADDFRLALRSLGRAPGFAGLVVLTLAAGIGLNAAIFSVVDCVLLRPLGYRDADRIVSIHTRFIDEGRSINKMGGEDFSDLARDVHGLEATAFYSGDAGDFSGARVGGEALYLPVSAVSPRFGQVMGVEPVAGRLFRPQGATATDALIGEGFAREHFGSASAALGQTVQVGPLMRVIVGVLPEAFAFPARTQIWLELAQDPETKSRSAYNQHVIGKRRLDVSPGELAAELSVFSRHLQTVVPEDKNKRLEAVPLQEEIIGRIRPTLRLLMARSP